MADKRKIIREKAKVFFLRLGKCTLRPFSIRKFEARDASEVSALIAKTLRGTNSRDYSPDYIEKEVALMTPDFLIDRAK